MSFQENKGGRLVKAPTDLLCEYVSSPLGIDVVQPRFSWVCNHSKRGQIQSAYQVLIGSNRANLDAESGDKWDSGRVISGQSVNIVHKGSSLESGKTYYWKVRIWDKDSKISQWSKVDIFEMGLLKPEDWKGEWIGGDGLFRKEFTTDKDIARARVYISGLGYYELCINGDKVGDYVLDPGWTDYKKRVLYSTYDIIKYLKRDKNAIGIMLGNGRYIKEYGYALPKVILQMNIEFIDGTNKIIVTDDTWKTAKSPIVSNDIYNGEAYDARLEKIGWDKPNYDDSDWNKARIAEAPGGKLVSQASFPPIKVIKIVQSLKITNPKPDVYIYDFGQNFTGWVRLCVSGPKGTKVNIRYAELLDEEGMINTVPNQKAKATDTYILKGEGKEIYEPRFTYHGFRYVEVTGFPDTPILENIEGRVVHSAVEPVGGFISSNPLINHIHKNILWGQLSNLMSIPTDCPQRNERMGWMGDAQLTAEEAIYNFDMSGFYTKWINDIREAQKEDGSVPDVVPPYLTLYPADPAWGTACVIIPWYLYQYYGDKRILEENYSLIKKWVEFLNTKTEDYIVSYFKYGDWCPPVHVKPVDTPGELTSTWYYYHDTLILSKIADVLGKSTDTEKYSKSADRIKEAFNKRFLKNDRYASGSQTSNILPLFLDMVPEDKREAVLKSLVDDIRISHSDHFNTGIVGTGYILDVLTKYGRADLAYKLITRTTYPGFGYMIREGATTVWERWEYLTGGGMNSHNHIMFGTVDTWFYKVLAGINVDSTESGFQRIIIKPYVVGDLKYISASIKTVRGIIFSSWEKNSNSLVLNVTLPVNSQAKVSVPRMGLDNVIVKESEKIIWEDGSFMEGVPGITGGSEEKDYVTFEVGSGSYSFRIK